MQASTSSAFLFAPAQTRSRGANIALWVLQGLVAALFAFAGINKLLGLQPEIAANFTKIGFGDWFRYLTGACEFVGALWLVIPRFTRAGALLLIAVMCGAILAHLTRLPPAYQAIGPLVILGLLCVILWGRWPAGTRATV